MNNIGGYRVLYYDNFKHFKDCKKKLKNPKILHDARTFDNKLISGKIVQSLESLWSFEFSIAYDHQHYNDINFIVGIVEVINLRDKEQEFIGRVLTTTGEMSQSGFFSKSFVCEDLKGYLHDSAQVFTKYKNDGVKFYFAHIINQHNKQVEVHKRFTVKDVTIPNVTDLPFRYTAYDDTFETIKTYVLERLGGYLVLEVDKEGHLYLDWLKEVGMFVNSPISLEKNIKTARRELNPENIITRLVPVGADKEDAVEREEETGQYVTRERVTIESVNNGLIYLEDESLVKEFGIIQKSVDWTEISDPHILKKRGEQYLSEQKLAIASWSVETIELYLIDNKFPKYKLGNKHPIENAPISGIENLQIVEKEIDILNPQLVNLKIGSSGQTLSIYQLQQQEAKKSMQRQTENEIAARKRVEAELNAKQKELENVQGQLKSEIERVDRQNNKNTLNTSKTQAQNSLEFERQNLEVLRTEKARLEALPKNQRENLNLVEIQINITETRITNYSTLIENINTKLKAIEDLEKIKEAEKKLKEKKNNE
ncbi:phage tail protein [Gemella sp. 19428wG2_WT2a]|nr:phage tail protein [Gemella sp. 19428wG2_WT2a]